MGLRSFVARRQAQANNQDVVFDARKVIRELNNLEPGLKREMQREFKTLAKPMVNDVQHEIRSLSPLSGMTQGNGRLNWDHGKYKGKSIQPDNVITRFRQSRSRRFAVTSLFGVWVRSPMVAITGSAGKGSGVPRKAVTSEYAYKGATRRHRVTSQGQTLISQVKSRYFNWFYKTAEKSMPHVESEVKLVWEKYSAKVSRRI